MGAIGFVGTNVASMVSPPSQAPANQQDMSGLSGSTSIESVDFSQPKKEDIQVSSGPSDDELASLAGLSQSKPSDKAQNEESSSAGVSAPVESNAPVANKKTGKAPSLNLGLDTKATASATDTNMTEPQSNMDQVPSLENAGGGAPAGDSPYTQAGFSSSQEIGNKTQSEQLPSVDIAQVNEINDRIEVLEADFQNLLADQISSSEVREIMNAVISGSDIATMDYVQREIDSIEIPQRSSLNAVSSNGNFLTKDEVEEILSLRIEEGIEKHKADSMARKSEIENLNSEIASLQEQLKELSKDRAQDNGSKRVQASPEKKKASEPKYTIADLHGRQRLPGFKIIGTEKNGKVALTSAPNGKVFRFFKGERIVLAGKGTFTVKAVLKNGNAFLVGNEYFIDTTHVAVKTTEPKKSKESEGSKSNEKSSTPDVTEDYIIAPSRPGSSNQGGAYTPKKASSTYEQRSRSTDGLSPEGWSFNGGRVEQSQYLIRKPNGKWGIVEKGDKTDIGTVKGLNRNGDLKIGNYILRAN